MNDLRPQIAALTDVAFCNLLKLSHKCCEHLLCSDAANRINNCHERPVWRAIPGNSNDNSSMY